MSRADEKRAFDAMLAEISDSDEDDHPAPIKGRSDRPTISSGPSRQCEPKVAQDVPLARRIGSAKMSKAELEIENFGICSKQSQAEVQSEQLSIVKRWLTRPCSRGDRSAMKCYVERERTGLGLNTTYRLFAEANGDGQQSRFLMAAKKKANKQTSYYLISLDMDPTDDRGSESVLGKVRGNTIGSRYLITDAGLAPEKTVAPSMLRREFGVVGFEFDSGGPSRIEAWVPAVTAAGVPINWQPDSDQQGMEASVEDKKLDKLYSLRNKTPKWDKAHGGHVLNFQGRVTESSVKNFQLCCQEADDPEDVVLQFGRVGKNRFTMDLKYPLSPLQAFGICVGCLDGKIADRKGYEYLRRMSSSNANSTNTNSAENSSLADPKEGQRPTDGSMKGSSSLSGMILETLPTGQYLRDKLYRSFK